MMKGQTITLENWDMPPFNRQTFLNMSDIIPVESVSRGNGPVRKFVEKKGDIWMGFPYL